MICLGHEVQSYFLSPAIEASSEVANLTERKNPHIGTCIGCQRNCLSVSDKL